MALYEYFKKGGPVFPTLRTCGEQGNTEALGESSGEPTGRKAVTTRAKYKHAAENGSTKVARYYSKL